MKLKQVPEDFLVREVMGLEPGKEGRFGYYKLWKRGWSTQSACFRVARALKVNPKVVNFAGNKDKQAVTEQFISILNGPARGLDLGDLRLEYLGRGGERITLGQLDGNGFRIVVRNLESGMEPVRSFPNYFDEQRFGMKLNNHLVGRLIIQRKFREAVELVPELEGKVRGNDFLGAIRSMPRRTVRLYMHSYQSWLWNRTVSDYLGKSRHRTVRYGLGELPVPLEAIENRKVPIIGYEERGLGEFREIIEALLEEDGVRRELFQLRSVPEADLKGGERDLMAEVRELELGEPEDDELNPGKKKQRAEFFLPKGAYATMAVKCFCKNSGTG